MITPYKITMTLNGPIFPVWQWLVTNVGKRFGPWNWSLIGDNLCVRFTYEEDKVKFILRWL